MERFTERLATEEEMDTIKVDIWSYRKGDDGLFYRTTTETLTLREAAQKNKGFRPLVQVRSSEPEC